MGVVGADAGALEALASEMRAAADELRRTRQQVNGPVHSAPWHGRSADRFRQQWDGQHQRSLASAAAFLERTGDDLLRQAAEQRSASGAEGGSIPVPAGPQGQPPSEEMDRVRRFLEELGLDADQIAAVLGKLGGALSQLKLIADVLDNGAVKGFIDAVGNVLDAVEVVTNFLTDLGQSLAEMPMDEALVHAVSETAVRFAVAEGVGAAVQVLTPVIMSVIPVAGTAAGVAVGKVAGWVVNKIVGSAVSDQVDKLDARYNVYDGSADAAVDAYRYLKERDFSPTEILKDGLGEAAEWVGDGMQNFYEKANNSPFGFLVPG